MDLGSDAADVTGDPSVAGAIEKDTRTTLKPAMARGFSDAERRVSPIVRRRLGPGYLSAVVIRWITRAVRFVDDLQRWQIPGETTTAS